MRSILSGGKVPVLLLIFTCFACGGSGGSGGGSSSLGELQANIDIPNPGETATVLVEIFSDGTVDWAAAVPVDLVPDVTGLTVNRNSDGSVLIDLFGTFDTTTGTTSGSGVIPPGDAADLAANPGDYVVTLLTSTKPPATGAFKTFTALEWHAVLLGSNESPVVNADARGAATFRIASPTSIQFVIAMADPVVTDVNNAHIHFGPAGVNGGIVLGLEVGTATVDATAGTLSGTVDVDGVTLARIAADPGAFYCNVHTVAAPNGVARGQLDQGTVEMSVAMLGSAETPTVVEANAQGGATLEFETLTSGRVLLALQSAAEGIENVIGSHIHVGDAGTPGPILVDVKGSDYSVDPLSFSAESTFTYTQKDFTRILANPAGHYCNMHTTAAPNGLVRGQLSMDPRTVNALLSGAEETTPVAGASGTMRVVFTGVHFCNYTITMNSPPATDITMAHIHDGPAGDDGPALTDLFLGGDMSVNGNIISGTAEVPGRTVARILAGTPGGSALAGGQLPSVFYGNVHTDANPLGVARGQFTQSSLTEPPANLSYTSPVIYLTGGVITPNAPTSTGGAVTSYQIAPALPAGLAFSTTTGIISGFPTETRAAQDYTVTASNAAGSTTATVNITVNVGPPTLLVYTTPVTYVVGQAITPNVPTSFGGAISTYVSNPTLPAGLSISSTTGVISGTPTTAQAQASYVITGSNSAGQVTKTIQITITQTLQPPSNLSYSTPVSYSSGYAITDNVPTVSGGAVANWSVNPALPAGLSLTASGTITGTPTTPTAQATYVVTATNAAGSTTANVVITITLGKPGPFTYSNDPLLAYIGTAYTMTPSHTGGGTPASYSISGTLPNGLLFSTTTGVVSGTPANGSSTMGFVYYTITATNSGGSTTTQISIFVY